MSPPQPPKRQARFVPGRVIVPEDLEPGRWYDVCQGRRRDDNRPGVVVLDLGTRRVAVPEACLEFRTALDRKVRRSWSRVVVIMMSAVPF